MIPILTIHTTEEMQAHADRLRREGKTIGFVPTMGFLHDGHLSLIRQAREAADHVVVSIFVNPTQFGPNEDFANYPRAFERDLQLTEAAGGNAVFAPDTRSFYPEGFETYVQLTDLPNHLCGLSRPVFLRGVATVVTKLFLAVKPHVAVFGEKDFQQLQVIRRMVRDLNFGITIIGGPTVREPDGLAMSSRNSYLTETQRPAALTLIRALHDARDRVRNGEREAATLIAGARSIITAMPGTDIDYIAICDPDTLVDTASIDGPALMALAVRVGTTRLIDNMILDPRG